MQANGAEGRKNDRLKKERERGKKRNLAKVDHYLHEKRGFLPELRLNSG